MDTLDIIQIATNYQISPDKCDLDILLALAKKGDETSSIAIQQILFTNFGLILHVTRKYLDFLTPTFDRDDLLSTAILGFIRAIQLYKPEYHVKFVTYAFTSMQYQIWYAIETQSKPLRLPTLLQRKQYRIKKSINTLQQEYRRKPTISEIAKNCEIPEKDVEYVFSLPSVESSLDDPNNHDSENTIGEIIPDKNDEFSNLHRGMNRNELAEFIKKILNPNQSLIIILHYGLNRSYEEGLKFSDIAKFLGISRERVRQLHAKAIEILMAPEYKEYLYFLLT